MNIQCSICGDAKHNLTRCPTLTEPLKQGFISGGGGGGGGHDHDEDEHVSAPKHEFREIRSLRMRVLPILRETATAYAFQTRGWDIQPESPRPASQPTS